MTIRLSTTRFAIRVTAAALVLLLALLPQPASARGHGLPAASRTAIRASAASTGPAAVQTGAVDLIPGAASGRWTFIGVVAGRRLYVYESPLFPHGTGPLWVRGEWP